MTDITGIEHSSQQRRRHDETVLARPRPSPFCPGSGPGMCIYAVSSVFLITDSYVSQPPSSTSSPPISVFTTISTSVGLNDQRQTTTSIATIRSTITLAASAPGPTGNSTNSTSSNSTSGSQSSSSSSSTPLSPAPTNVDGGGGQNGAPVPGGSSNGAYGPDDSFVAAALTNSALLALSLSVISTAFIALPLSLL